MCLNTHEFADILTQDDNDPEYVVATDKCFLSVEYLSILKKYMTGNRKRIFILFSRECMECDLNVFDYAVIWNRKHTYPGRIMYNVPYIYNSGEISQHLKNSLFTNTLSYEDASGILHNTKRFCNFIYSHASPQRDKFFRMLSQYKKVDSLGKHLNNTGTESTRGARNWYDLSIDMKKDYKFSIAMENASYSGYTTEKIISSLRAHTVPIYWGDPDVSEFINPEAFINCHEYSSLEDVIKRVREIDNDDEQFLYMITRPWQTEEQQQRTLDYVEQYREFFRNIFLQDIAQAKRRPEGLMPDMYFGNFWLVNMNGRAMLKEACARAWRKLKRAISYPALCV